MFSLRAQCAISVIVGCVVYMLLSDDPNPKVPLFGALIAGFGATWIALWLSQKFLALRAKKCSGKVPVHPGRDAGHRLIG